MLPKYISKYIQIMDNHIKLPLLTSPRTSGPFTFLNNETSDVTMTRWPFMLLSTTKGLLKNMWETFL